MTGKNSFRAFVLIFILGSFFSIASSLAAKGPDAGGQALDVWSRPSFPGTIASSLYGLHWIRSYHSFFSGLAGDDYYTPTAIVPTGDGGFVVAGQIGHFVPGTAGTTISCGLVMEVRPSGAIDWQVVLEDFPTQGDETYLNDLVRTLDGGYVAVGSVGKGTSNFYIMAMKISHDGRVQWVKEYEMESDDNIHVAATNDGGAVLAADFFGQQSENTWLAKLGPTGDIIWQEGMGDLDPTNTIQPTTDGGFLIVGSPEGDIPGDSFVSKLDAAGRTQWNKRVHFDTEYDNDEAKSVVCEPDGSSVVSGMAGWSGDHGFYRAWVFKLDSSGHMIWQKAYDSSNFGSETSIIIKTKDGGYVFTEGSVAYKITPSGDPEWKTTYSDTSIQAATPNGEGGFAFAGEMWPEAFGVMNLNEKGMTGSDCSLIQRGLPDSWRTSAKVQSESYLVRKTNAWVQHLDYHPHPRPCQFTTICVHVPSQSSDSPKKGN